jgi:N6-L-threonylcarbamoyladenine synthase
MLRFSGLEYRLANLRTSWMSRSFTVLALESSADDTCAAVVTSSREILSNIVVKQNEMSVEKSSSLDSTKMW